MTSAVLLISHDCSLSYH